MPSPPYTRNSPGARISDSLAHRRGNNVLIKTETNPTPLLLIILAIVLTACGSVDIGIKQSSKPTADATATSRAQETEIVEQATRVAILQATRDAQSLPDSIPSPMPTFTPTPSLTPAPTSEPTSGPIPTPTLTPTSSPTITPSPAPIRCTTGGIEGNIVLNPGFEDGPFTPYRTPPCWLPDSFVPGATLVWDNAVAHSGSNSARIDSPEPNDARFIQEVLVDPRTDYVLSGWIKTENVQQSEDPGYTGANIGLFNTWEHTPGLFGSSDWTFVSMEFNSGDYVQITIACRLGHWGGTVTGTAWFDDVTLVRK